VKVAMGGLHVSVRADEAKQHADYVIVGEGENVWPAVVEAAEQATKHAAAGGEPGGEPPRTFDSIDYPPVNAAALSREILSPNGGLLLPHNVLEVETRW